MAEFKLPELGENIEEAEVIRLLISEGDEIQADQAVMEVESDKAATSLPCPLAGKVARIHVAEGETIRVGQTLLSVEEKEAAEESPSSDGEEQPPEDGQEHEPGEEAPAVGADGKASGSQQSGDRGLPVPAGPATRKRARELGVQLEEVQGTGPGGRIVREDVEKAARQRQGTPRGQAVPPLPDFSRWGPVRRQRLNRLARTTAERLSLSWQLVPHVTQHELADITRLEASRQRYDRHRSQGQPKITLTVLAVKAAVAALQAYPRFNSSFDSESGELILKDYFHIGVAVDTEEGLLVPVLRDADRKSTSELARELAELADKARRRKLAAEEMEGGTFTVTNLGGIGGIAFTPIVYYPQVAILGLARTRSRRGRRSRRNSRRGRLELPLSLSYDHRVINGADGARFIEKLADLLAEPFTLMTEI
jgi:pyruvate dehydrogenase E2 component (dihydrolipoamide acetyltransferase)